MEEYMDASGCTTPKYPRLALLIACNALCRYVQKFELGSQNTQRVLLSASDYTRITQPNAAT